MDLGASVSSVTKTCASSLSAGFLLRCVEDEQNRTNILKKQSRLHSRECWIVSAQLIWKSADLWGMLDGQRRGKPFSCLSLNSAWGMGGAGPLAVFPEGAPPKVIGRNLAKGSFHAQNRRDSCNRPKCQGDNEEATHRGAVSS